MSDLTKNVWNSFNHGAVFIYGLMLFSIIVIICVVVAFIRLMKNKHLGRFCQKINQFGFLPLLEEDKKTEYLIYVEKYAKRHRNMTERLSKTIVQERKPEVNTYISNDSVINIPFPISLNIVDVISKQYDYICNYIYFQISNKIFGVASVVFSFICLYINQSGLTDNGDMVKYANLFCSFISIVCVIIALYLSPVSRVSQYINSWKMLDGEINRIYSSLYVYNELSNLITKEETKEKAMKEIEAEATKISKLLREAERNLTSDGE